MKSIAFFALYLIFIKLVSGQASITHDDYTPIVLWDQEQSIVIQSLDLTKNGSMHVLGDSIPIGSDAQNFYVQIDNGQITRQMNIIPTQYQIQDSSFSKR
ncbi:UNKNOWN [Stylonychia lemnae]|uniref:Uncharacterized protein n=1 Tax=Stylonychia lemnae TaxID=5949 RepID=A0A077ZMA7_STYLE|nr:UNKNOWN [Stylonychia lemnae]|eukprot:CDW71117.1 UNKNOWN [Stylonychia lemnae]